jgi:hypothetical protein
VRIQNRIYVLNLIANLKFGVPSPRLWTIHGFERGMRNEQMRLNRIPRLLVVVGISHVWPAQLGNLDIRHPPHLSLTEVYQGTYAEEVPAI